MKVIVLEIIEISVNEIWVTLKPIRDRFVYFYIFFLSSFLLLTFYKSSSLTFIECYLSGNESVEKKSNFRFVFHFLSSDFKLWVACIFCIFPLSSTIVKANFFSDADVIRMDRARRLQQLKQKKERKIKVRDLLIDRF